MSLAFEQIWALKRRIRTTLSERHPDRYTLACIHSLIISSDMRCFLNELGTDLPSLASRGRFGLGSKVPRDASSLHEHWLCLIALAAPQFVYHVEAFHFLHACGEGNIQSQKEHLCLVCQWSMSKIRYIPPISTLPIKLRFLISSPEKFCENLETHEIESYLTQPLFLRAKIPTGYVEEKNSYHLCPSLL